MTTHGESAAERKSRICIVLFEAATLLRSLNEPELSEAVQKVCDEVDEGKR